MPDDQTEEPGETPSEPEPETGARGVQASDLAEQFQAVMDRLNRAGQAGVGALGLGVPSLVREWLSLLEAATTQATVPIKQLEAVMSALRAQRESVQALRSQLAVFDQQLGALESAIKPFAEWGRQWVRVQDSVVGKVRDLSQSSEET